MKSITVNIILCFTFCIQTVAKDRTRILPHGPRVIPIMLDEAMLKSMGMNPGDNLWFEMLYTVSPNGKVFFEEAGEKIWWIQDKPLLLLGSTGIPLPASLTRRVTAYVKILFDGKEIKGSPFLLEPQKDAVVIGLEPGAIKKSLSRSLISINATYLSQVANYLAQNVAALDVQGSSYSVDGYGTVINGAGEWVGPSTRYDSSFYTGTMILVDSGAFVQGSSTDPCAGADETPFTHTLTRRLLVMETEVTRRMWSALMLANSMLPMDPSTPNTPPGPGSNYPVSNVTWFEAILFANLLSVELGLTPCYYTFTDGIHNVVDPMNYNMAMYYICDFDANGYRLPTEGEWEYMARAGTTGPFSIDEPNYNETNCPGFIPSPGLPALESVAVFNANGPLEGGPGTVGSKGANPWGLKDMHGNLYEWCWDFYDTYPADTTDYTGSMSGPERVVRGGYYESNPQLCRSANRYSYEPSIPYYGNGFRLVRTYP